MPFGLGSSGLNLGGLALENASPLIEMSFSDTITLSDAFEFTGLVETGAADSISLSDVAEIRLDGQLEFADSISLSDLFEFQINGNLEAAESISLSDSVEVVLESLSDFSDSISLTDNVEILLAIACIVEDQIVLSDSLQSDFLINIVTLSLEVSDSIEIIDGFTQLQSDPNDLQIFERLIFSDEIQVAEPIDGVFDETLSLSDTLELLNLGIREAYDTLQYNWLDEVKVELEQVVNISDSLSLSDEVTVELIIFALPISVSDSLSLSDSVAIEISAHKSLQDSLSITDDFETFMTHLYEVSDSISLSDSLETSVNGNASLGDQITLTDDVQIALSIQIVVELTIQISDAISLSDHVQVAKPLNMTDYMRRYLNDVVS
jgi:hypothetical protein